MSCKQHTNISNVLTKMQFSTFEFILGYFHALHEATVCVLPDVGVVLQAEQRMLRVIEDSLLDAQFGPGGPTDGRLSRGCVFDRETGTDVTNGDCLDVSCNVTTMLMISSQLLFSYI